MDFYRHEIEDNDHINFFSENIQFIKFRVT